MRGFVRWRGGIDPNFPPVFFGVVPIRTSPRPRQFQRIPYRRLRKPECSIIIRSGPGACGVITQVKDERRKDAGES